MTIEDLLDKKASELIKMTDDELNLILGPYFKYARPDPSTTRRDSIIESSSIPRPGPRSFSKHKQSGSQTHALIQNALLQKARELGIDPTKI